MVSTWYMIARSDEESDVEHLGKDSFETALKDKEHYLVMFYAP